MLSWEASRDARFGERLGKLRDLQVFQVGEIRAAQEARSIVESRYLDGQGALWADVAAAWDEQVRSTMAIADAAVLLAKLGGVTPAALDKLGEAERALTIATGCLRMMTKTKMHLGASAAAEER